jgi:hypothetical protein
MARLEPLHKRDCRQGRHVILQDFLIAVGGAP